MIYAFDPKRWSAENDQKREKEEIFEPSSEDELLELAEEWGLDVSDLRD